MNFQTINDEALLKQSRELAEQDRKITHALLLRINEVHRRSLHLKLGFGSLMDWLVKDLKYSHGAAGRRIAAAKLLNDVPVAAEKILDGSINLSTLCQVQTTIRAEEKRTQLKVSVEQKKELLEKIDSKSQRETEFELAHVFPQAVKVQERVSVIAEDHVRVTVTFTQAQLAKLERVKELNSNSNHDASLAETIEFLADAFLQRKDPLRKSITPSAAAADLKSESNSLRAGESGLGSKDARAVPYRRSQRTHIVSRAIPSALRHAVMLRDRGECQFVDPKTRRKCASRFQVQIDHVQPWALGGEHALENLRCLCRAHNTFRATQTFTSRNAALSMQRQ